MDQAKNKEFKMFNKVERMTLEHEFNKKNNKPGTKQIDKSK